MPSRIPKNPKKGKVGVGAGEGKEGAVEVCPCGDPRQHRRR